MTVSLRTMAPAKLKDWLAAALNEYAQDRMKAGEPETEAHANAAEANETFFPDGVPAEGHLVFDVLLDGDPVGFLWIGPERPAREGTWWVWDVAIDEAHRGAGIGRAAMQLAEEEAKERGGTELGLHVFGFNTVARNLYESLGYEPVSIRMAKKLT